MLPGWVIVFDTGKTLAKASLWDASGQLVEQQARRNLEIDIDGRRCLDAEGIEAWIVEVMSEFARKGPVSVIVPVGHGAAAAIVRNGRLACAIPDYEAPIPAELRRRYDALRDRFAATGSPGLPDGLNLGVQLYRLQEEQPELFEGDARILPWPQYWAWKMCGVAASEISSLGCHTDLWRPGEDQPSSLARGQGWAQRLAPLFHARQPLGTLTPEWSARTGLSPRVQVLCGLHDSNAALLASRGFPELAQAEGTVLSTGTWFVAMRTPGPGTHLDLESLPEARDCLVNIDVDGRPIPSARFMGGRELELLGGLEDLLEGMEKGDTASGLAAVLAAGTFVLPCWAQGVGPYPRSQGRWVAEPDNTSARRAAVALYAALMVDRMLELIGTRERLLIEGRFARSALFVQALARMRHDLQVYVNGGAEGGLRYGALRLVEPTLPPSGELQRVAPLESDLSEYRTQWRRLAYAEDPLR